MPKVRCACDHVIWLGEIPCPHEWLIISDTRYSSFYDKADDSVKVDIEELYKATLPMVRCSECERLLIFWDGWNGMPTFYRREHFGTQS